MDETTPMRGPMPDNVMAPTRQPGMSDSSLERMLGLLDLFTEDRPSWSVEEICDHLSMSQATGYRYLKLLSRTGLLAPAEGSAFILGPRIVQLDRLMRRTDPLLRHGVPVIERARPELHGMFLLSRHYGDHVLCVHQDMTDPTLRTSMERGRPMELFQGAAPRVVLAFLPTYQLRNLMLRHPDRIRAAGLGASWEEFRARLKAVRKEGTRIAIGEVDAGMVGVAAPIFRAPGAVVGAISLAQSEERFRTEDPARLRALALRIADEISAGFTGGGHQPNGRPT
ncbi:IclR family transcriptional regulator [Humitalea rosea]|uniref:IclR family transcriptional regulator n=1 Tax=Humitalea rosea TaxID=990373 RepID=A0A2W7IFH0_9PROT|nr:IclR family transcriptional regulator [Humitalea rosea]PZW44828.1 IclR family transcriptional regulator [Humitalea rosea]